MAMQRQVISLPFSQGVDTKTDSKLSSKPSRLQNAIFQGGTIVKRAGTRSLPSAIDTGGSQSAGGLLFSTDAELCLINTTTRGLSSATNQWITKPGNTTYCSISREQIKRNTRTQTNADQASANGITVFAWIEQAAPQRGIHVAVYDDVSQIFFQTGDTAVVATTDVIRGLRCVAVGGAVVVLYADKTDGKIYSGSINTGSPETAISFTAIKTDLWTGAMASSADNVRMDACKFTSSNGLAVYMGPTNADFTTFTFNGTGAVVSSNAWLAQVTAGKFTSINCQVDSSNNFYIFWRDNTGGVVSYLVTNSSWAAIKAKTTVGTVAVINNSTTVEGPSGTINFVLSLPTDTTFTLYSATVTSAAVTSSLAVIASTKGMTLLTDAFLLNGTPVVGVATMPDGLEGTDTQPTAFICDLSGNPVARFLSGLAGLPFVPSPYVAGTALFPQLPRPVALGNDIGVLVYELGRLEFQSSTGSSQPTNVTPMGLTRIRVTPVTNTASLPLANINGITHIGGALPRSYDGTQIIEDGIPLPPLKLAKSTTFAAGGNLSTGVYQMVAIYSWVDSKGQLVRSPASPPLSFTATATDSQKVLCYTLPISSRDVLSQGPTVQIEFYRTEANGALFYRDSLVTSPVYCSYDVTLPSFIATQSDAALVAGELLYTTGGVNDWLSPPPYIASCVHNDRLIVCTAENQFAWQSSSASILGEALRFNEAWGGTVPANTGPLVGCASLDGNLIMFTTRAAYLIQGDGPDLTGNNNWSPPQRITGVDSGAVSPRSILSTSFGIIYQSQRGFVLLDRSLTGQYIGADVEQFSNYICRSAVYLPDVQQARFLVDLGSDLPGSLNGEMTTGNGGYCLVYDIFYKQWSWFTNYGGQSACLFQNKFTRVLSNGVVTADAPGTYKDNGLTYSSYVETAWLKVAGIQGFQRLWRALVLGNYNSNFTLNWAAAYDYVLDYSADTLTENGQGTFTVSGPIQLRRHMRKQKCEAVKFLFWDSNILDNGQGLSLTDLSLEVGVKPVAFKLPAAQSL